MTAREPCKSSCQSQQTGGPAGVSHGTGWDLHHAKRYSSLPWGPDEEQGLGTSGEPLHPQRKILQRTTTGAGRAAAVAANPGWTSTSEWGRELTSCSKKETVRSCPGSKVARSQPA